MWSLLDSHAGRQRKRRYPGFALRSKSFGLSQFGDLHLGQTRGFSGSRSWDQSDFQKERGIAEPDADVEDSCIIQCVKPNHPNNSRNAARHKARFWFGLTPIEAGFLLRWR